MRSDFAGIMKRKSGFPDSMKLTRSADILSRVKWERGRFDLPLPILLLTQATIIVCIIAWWSKGDNLDMMLAKMPLGEKLMRPPRGSTVINSEAGKSNRMERNRGALFNERSAWSMILFHLSGTTGCWLWSALNHSITIWPSILDGRLLVPVLLRQKTISCKKVASSNSSKSWSNLLALLIVGNTRNVPNSRFRFLHLRKNESTYQTHEQSTDERTYGWQVWDSRV